MSAQREKKPLLRSCEPCRTSKIRCMPDEISQSKCQRCQRLGKNCFYAEVKTRTRKNAASNVRRVQELERKIDRLSSLLQEAPDNVEDSPPSPRASGPFSVGGTSTMEGGIDQLGMQITPPDSSLGQPSPIDVVSKGWLTESQAEELLQTFHREFGQFSPFVVVASIPLERLRMEKPSVLLAILVAASRHNFALQTTLEQEFKTYCSNSVLMDGARSLELLQGLLVYISWYYHRFRVIEKQLFMFVQIMTAITFDIDLLDRAKRCNEVNEESLEIKRTLLGVYYFSSGLPFEYGFSAIRLRMRSSKANINATGSSTCLVQRRPTAMRCSFALWDCARFLAAANTAPSDPQLIHFVYLQSLVEEIADAFGYINEEGRRLLTIGNLESIEFRVNAFKNRLEQIRVSIPPGKALSSLLLFTCRSVRVYLYEVALHIPAVSAPESRSEQSLSIQPQALSSLSNLLWECLDAVKVLFEQFLQLTPAEISGQSVLEKGHLAHGAMILIKLAFCRIPGVDGFPLRKACNVSGQFDTVCEKVGKLSTTSEFAEHQDGFQHFKNTAQTLKAWYLKMEASSPSLVELTSMNPLELADIAKDYSFLDFDWRTLDTFLAADGCCTWATMWV